MAIRDIQGTAPQNPIQISPIDKLINLIDSIIQSIAEAIFGSGETNQSQVNKEQPTSFTERTVTAQQQTKKQPRKIKKDGSNLPSLETTYTRTPVSRITAANIANEFALPQKIRDASFYAKILPPLENLK